MDRLYGINWGTVMLSNKNDSKLFDAVCKGQTGNIKKYLNLGANINARDREDGTTPLMKSCIRRNYVVQKLLLYCGADPNLKDVKGLTALHFVAESGDVESIKLFIAYQANIDSIDKFGCTPLHYASNRKHQEAADLLVFCGADAYQEDEWWRTPMTVCPETEILDTLKDSEMVLNGLKNNDISIQNIELEQNCVYVLEKLGLTITVPETFKTNSLSFLCRRVRPEYSHQSLRPKGRELLISDTFEYRISTVQINGTVTLEIPLYDFPDPFEEVYMKTDVKPDIDIDEKLTEIHRIKNEVNPSELKWFCKATVDITKMRAFNLVAFPKVENFKVGQEGGKFSSNVDKFVHMSVSPGTFEEDGTLSLEVIPSLAFRDDIYQDIVSISHFYDITYNASVGHQLQEDVTLLIPLPQYYSGEGDLYLMSARVTSDFYVDDIPEDTEQTLELWEILDKDPVTRRGKIISQLPHFSIWVLTETKKGLDIDDVKLQTDSLLRRASKRKTFVIFFCAIKPIGYDIYDVVVECTTPQKRIERINYWLAKRYIDQSPSDAEEFDVHPGKEFSITFRGNIRRLALTGSDGIRLQFHPKRHNYQRLQLTIKNKNRTSKGSIYIREFEKQSRQYFPITNFEVHLAGEPFIEDIVQVKGKESKEIIGFKGFTRDQFLWALSTLIGDDWVKVSLMLGITYKTIDDIRLQCLQSSYVERTMKVLQYWRDMSMHRLDSYGVPDLMSALKRVDRNDLVEFVIDELQKWLLERKDDRDTFYYWVVETLQGPEIHSGGEGLIYPEPMTDIFFLMMVEACQERLESIGPRLRLSQAEMDSLFDDPMIPNYQHRLLRMLITAREKNGNLSDAFIDLVTSLEDIKMKLTLHWVIQASRHWLDENPDVETPIRQTVEEYLETKGDALLQDMESIGFADVNVTEQGELKKANLARIEEVEESSDDHARSESVLAMRGSPEYNDHYDLPKRSKSGKGVRWEDPVVKTIHREPESD